MSAAVLWLIPAREVWTLFCKNGIIYLSKCLLSLKDKNFKIP
jgi:hypothetical protein